MAHKPKPLDVFGLHSLPHIAAHIDKMVKSIEARMKKNGPPTAKKSNWKKGELELLSVILTTLLPLVSDTTYRARIESLINDLEIPF